MPGDSPPFAETDRIVDEVLDGKRAFVFWPGSGTLVTIIMLHVFAMALWWAPIVSACRPWLQAHVEHWQPLLFIAFGVSMPCFAVPVALLVRGNEYGPAAFLLTTRAWFVGSALCAIAAALEWFRAPAWPYGVVCGLLAVAYVLEGSESYGIYVLLRRRLRVRIAERAALREKLTQR